MRLASHPSLSDLSSLLDGEGLVPSAIAVHLAHLGGCARCAARLEGMGRARAALRSLPQPAPPPELDLRLRVALAGASGRSALIWPAALQPRRVLAPLCALLVVAVVAVTYLETEARARASTIARESLERMLSADRFESILDGPEPAADRLVRGTWSEPGLADDGTLPLRRFDASSREARSLLAAFGDARRALEMPGVRAVRLRTAGGMVEIRRASPPV